jgi:ribosome biogenesis protein ENP2
MHGYFVDLRLYTKARAIANPFAYAEHREKLIREKLEKEQESRIRGAKKVAGTAVPAGVKVNRSLAKKAAEIEERSQKRAAGVVEDDGAEKKRKKKNAGVETPSLLKDDRFSSLFTNPDYQIDEDSREFALLNPSTKPKVRPQLLLSRATATEDIIIAESRGGRAGGRGLWRRRRLCRRFRRGRLG